ncbi:MAG: thioester reductase domain-containing protein [Halioglobus sp.]
MNSTEKMMANGSYLERITALLTDDVQLTAMFPDLELYKSTVDAKLNTPQAVDRLLAGYDERPALGMRDYEITESSSTGKMQRHYLPSFSSITYLQFRQRIQAIASAWQSSNELAVKPGDFVCIIGFTSIDYAAIDLACLYAQAVSTPLQSTTSGTDFDDIFANVQPAAVAATVDDIVTAAQHVASNGGVRSLIVFDYDKRDENDRQLYQQAAELLAAANCKTRLLTLDEIIGIGEQSDWEFLPPHPEGPDRLAMILHSSGSTGKPKGAMINEAAVAQWWLDDPEPFPTVSVMFMPLNHGMGKLALTFILRKGSHAFFTVKPDMSTLFEDIRLTRPTMLSFFPRIFELIYQHYQNEVAKQVNAGVSESAASEQVMQSMRFSYLGDRLTAGLVGSAPTPEVVKEFIVECFQIPLKEGYGNTEAGSGSITMDNMIQRPNVIDYKLVDVPELGYFTTDKPYPRGELCYKSLHAVKGYYNDPEATAALLDAEGFTQTGDIVEERGPDHVVLIDRRKDVLKLSQGEYVAVGPLGTVFEAGSAVIEQIYIYGNSSKAYLLAVVVPNQTAVATALEGGFSEAELKRLIKDELQRVARQQDLKSFEVPRDFIVEAEAFSVDNGLLSSVRKRLRPQLKSKYGEDLEALYTAHETQEQERIDALKNADNTLSTLEKLSALIAIELKLNDTDISHSSTFSELGGDSLSAVAFSLSIEEVFEVSLSGDSVLSPTGCLEKWALEIDQLSSDENPRPSYATIHGGDSTTVHASDLNLQHFLGDSLEGMTSTCEKITDSNQVVLLTGANGFLGRAVCIAWLEKLAQTGGKLICLIRAHDDNLARQRLDQVFAGATPNLYDLYQTLSEKHLEVIAGDAAQEWLGLGEHRFTELAKKVDRICHVAALVNHRLAYKHLFGPNVSGTAEIIRLAATQKQKTIDFVSTEGVLPLLNASQGNNEDALPIASVPLVESYAAGYATSKWASEVLLHQAHQQLGTPVNILRGNMMLAHKDYVGQINTADMFTRLLYSIITTGLAPYSFYPLSEEGSRQPAHYDGLPVDVVAASVVGAASTAHQQYRCFNINNYHDDGMSLDSFTDWIESAGYAVTRMEDYSQWYKRFKDKLTTLPEEQKKYSALDILAAFETPNQLGADQDIACNNFKQMAGALFETGLPHLDEPFIHKCLADMRHLGLIEDPAASTQ